MEIANLVLFARMDVSSSVEKTADMLLTPIRTCFHGKKVYLVGSQLFEAEETSSLKNWTKTAKVILVVVTFPLTIIGVAIKLTRLVDADYRSFCAKAIQILPHHPQFYTIFQHVHSTAQYTQFLAPSFFELPALKFRSEGLELEECACKDFHRWKTPRRSRLENAVVQRLVNVHANKNQPVHLLSMGSGGLMCDFMILEKLILAGFTDIHLDCVDIKAHKDTEKKLQDIRNFFSTIPQISININFYDKIESVPKKEPYAAVLAIDYVNFIGDFYVAAVDLLIAYQRLDSRGCLALGYENEDLLYGLDMVRPNNLFPNKLFLKNAGVCKLADDIVQHLPEGKELTIGVPSDYFKYNAQLLFALSFIREKLNAKYSTITFLLSSSAKSCREYKDRHEWAEGLFGPIEVKRSFDQQLQICFPPSSIESNEPLSSLIAESEKVAPSKSPKIRLLYTNEQMGGNVHTKCDFQFTGPVET